MIARHGRPQPAARIGRMTLTELKYIVAVARERHFGRAAEACHVSQPTLSVAIRKLEDELGVPLFERGGTEVTVTPIGLQIVVQAQRVLDETATLREIAEQGRDPLAGALRVGVIYTIGPYLLPHIVGPLRKAVPRLKMMLYEYQTAPLLEKLGYRPTNRYLPPRAVPEVPPPKDASPRGTLQSKLASIVNRLISL